MAAASSPQELVQAAAADGQTALALTDTHTLAGAVQFAQACRNAGIKPILGATVEVDGHPLVLLCADRDGYANLCDLLTLAHTNRLQPGLTLNQLHGHTDGLLCLTGDRSGALATAIRERKFECAKRLVEVLGTLFPDRLFVELTRHRRPGERTLVRTLWKLAQAHHRRRSIAWAA